MTSVETIEQGIQKLPAKDHRFAQSLVDWSKRKPLSSKQQYWADKFAAIINGNGESELPPAVNPNLKLAQGGFDTINNLLGTAKKHLKRPKIVLFGLRLSVAGERARVPGSINVVGDATRNWYGRILQDGTFQPTHKIPVPETVIERLKYFNGDPLKAAREHGHLTGKCCFCNLPLDDERSTAVGYGPVCAKHYNLPWGK